MLANAFTCSYMDNKERNSRLFQVMQKVISLKPLKELVSTRHNGPLEC